jgi:hypothetical protein
MPKTHCCFAAMTMAKPECARSVVAHQMTTTTTTTTTTPTTTPALKPAAGVIKGLLTPPSSPREGPTQLGAPAAVAPRLDHQPQPARLGPHLFSRVFPRPRGRCGAGDGTRGGAHVCGPQHAHHDLPPRTRDGRRDPRRRHRQSIPPRPDSTRPSGCGGHRPKTRGAASASAGATTTAATAPGPAAWPGQHRARRAPMPSRHQPRHRAGRGPCHRGPCRRGPCRHRGPWRLAAAARLAAGARPTGPRPSHPFPTTTVPSGNATLRPE